MLQYSPKIVQDGLVMCLDPSQNKSYPTTDLPVKNGLVMWMDAADDTTFSYSSGTTVSQWRDKSGFNYHMTPLAGSPTRNAFQNSRKVVAFTTTQDIQNTSIDLRTSPYTVFIVSRYTSPSAGTGRILTSNGGYNNWLLGHWASETNKYYANGWVYQTYAAIDTNWKLYLGDWGGSSNNIANFYAAGTALATNSTAATAGPWTLGINASSGERSNCEAAEIIVFNRLLSATERRLVHTYLGQKWGISNTDRQIFDLSGNNFNFSFNGTNPRYNAKTIVSNFNTTSPYAVSSFGGQNLTSNILNLLYSDHTIEVAFNAKGFRSVYSYDNTLTTQDGQCIVLWTGQHSGLRVFQNTIIYEYWNSQSSTVGIGVSISSYIDKIIYITATRTGNTLRIYINGVLASGPTTVAATTSPIPYSQINIGAAYQGNPTTQGYIWAGQHEYHLLRMYNRQLTDTEVASNYQAFKARFDNNIVRFGLIMELDAGNPYSYAGAGTTIYDVSPTALSWTGSNVTYNSDPVKYFSYNGSNSWLQSSTSTAYDSQTITMECWCYPNTLFQDGFLFEKGQVNTQYSMFIALAGVFYFRTIGGTINNQDLTFTASNYITANAWNHIACTYNGSIKIVYVNGVQAASVAASGTLQTGQTNQYIGKYGAATNNFPFNGRIAESRVYNIALSAAQVLQNYNATKGRFGL